jgi:glutaredoxin
MSRLAILVFVLFTTLSLSAQKDIQLLEREENGLTIISAKNISKTDYQLTLTIESTGVVNHAMPYPHLLKAGMTADMVTVTPQPGIALSYKTSVSFTAASGPMTVTTPAESDANAEAPKGEQSTDAQRDIEGIVLYTKPGCGRCRVAKDHLRSLKAQFTEIDITKQSAEVNALWTGLREQGLKGNSVMTPVIARDGIYYHEITDIRTFLDELVSGQK